MYKAHILGLAMYQNFPPAILKLSISMTGWAFQTWCDGKSKYIVGQWDFELLFLVHIFYQKC